MNATAGAATEPLVVGKPEAGRLLALHPDTVARMPASRTGKVRLGRRTVFIRAKLIELVTQLHAEQAGTTTTNTGGGTDDAER